MTKKNKHKLSKDTILIICISSIFLLVFITYGYSLLKKQEEHQRNIPIIVTKKEEDPEYSSYCDCDIQYEYVNRADIKGSIMSQELLIKITNSKETFYKWTLKIPSNRIQVDNLTDVSYKETNRSIYLKNFNNKNIISPDEPTVIGLTVHYKPGEDLSKILNLMLITECSTYQNKDNLIYKGNAYLEKGELDIELNPEITLENRNNNTNTYAIYIHNDTDYNIGSYRASIASTGTIKNTSPWQYSNITNPLMVVENKNGILKSHSKSSKYTLVIDEVSEDYIPDIVVLGIKDESIKK